MRRRAIAPLRTGKSVDSTARSAHSPRNPHGRISFGTTTQLSTAEEAARTSEGEQERAEANSPRTPLTAERTGENAMSKGMDQKKQEKKKPAKTLDEKRAAKKAKKAARASLQRP
jgi:hypothetical protein